MNNHHTAHARTALLLALTLALAGAAAGALGASSAYAGDWMEVSCVNPNQSAAPGQGWTSFTTGSPGYGSNNSTGCGPGSPMLAILSADAAAGVGSGEILQYSPPAGSTLTGGQVDVSMYADGRGYDASGTAVAYSPEFAYNGSNVIFQCASGLPPCANGTYDYSGVLGLPTDRGGSFYIGAGCGGGSGAACNEGGSEGAWSLVRVWWANFLLESNATPAASGVGGTLLSPNASGTAELTLDASDPTGPGVYVVTVQIDGKTLYSATPNTNGGECVPVGESDGALMFDYSQPCRASESVDLPIDTTALTNGQHTLKVIVEDAAQNSSVVYDGTITTQNTTAATSPLGALPGPGTSSPNASAETSSTGAGGVAGFTASAGTANGTNASEDAQLRLGVRPRITRTFAHRALRVSGRLLASDGQPIDGATLDVSQQIAGSTTLKLIGHAKTGANGDFAVGVTPGPSRLIDIAYRAFSADTSYAAQARIEESVHAGVRLNVTPRLTGSEGTIALSGRVLGSVPSQGVVIELLVHYRGHWEPFRDPRTDSHGRFRVVYQFEGGVGRFPFRALAFGGQSGFPFIHGESGAIDVTTN